MVQEHKNMQAASSLEERLRRISQISPATKKAQALGECAKSVNFDWPKVEGMLAQFYSEVDELKVEFQRRKHNLEAIKDELSDVYYSIAQVCRHLGLDAEEIAEQGNLKFLRRFQTMAEIVNTRGIEWQDQSPEQLLALWKQAKLSCP